jgi:hypothetical protein
VERAGLVADLGIKLHAHMLRHSTGYDDVLMMLRLSMAGPQLMLCQVSNGAQLFVFQWLA